MKKVVLMFVAMFALTTAMAQEDCSKKCEKAKTEKKCDGNQKDCCEGKKHEGCDKKMEGCKKHEGCEGKKMEGCKKHEGCEGKKMEGCKKHEGCEDQKPCRTGMMVKELGLDENQAAKVKELKDAAGADGIELQVNAKNRDAYRFYRKHGFTEKSINMELL